ncbi:nucleoside 2-deoxyribosyltransferase domain-containing protein [Tenacibaculum agarivorans]|uniref:nucleoside 2-deoxyribosyltransferase domain-containing protein n=1 Tax=Tenacibaculum agarivorans TaxID=1908389 RepID=UPI00094B8621|nr:nucleoside 2-deoxyribosyltransferase domain-containing protein [Tenacibaculum agarivorans]
MIYTSKDELPIKEEGYQYYFLAGSIDYTTAKPWRFSIIQKNTRKIHFLDPTNTKHDQLTDKAMKNHILWELNALEFADKIILNLLPEATSPISLVELGLYAKSEKLIVICPDSFYKSRYVHVLCEKYDVPLYKNLINFKFV